MGLIFTPPPSRALSFMTCILLPGLVFPSPVLVSLGIASLSPKSDSAYVYINVYICA